MHSLTHIYRYVHHPSIHSTGNLLKSTSKHNQHYIPSTLFVFSEVGIDFSDQILPQSAVLALDDSILDVDQVENLIKFCPTKEEMELLKVHILNSSPFHYHLLIALLLIHSM